MATRVEADRSSRPGRAGGEAGDGREAGVAERIGAVGGGEAAAQQVCRSVGGIEDEYVRRLWLVDLQ